MLPYLVNIRSYIRYKKIPHHWLQHFQNEEEFNRLARRRLMPLAVTPEGESLQDTAPVIELMEQVHPDDPTLVFLSALIEEYGDEWVAKLMFRHRWLSKADRSATSHILAREILLDGDRDEVDGLAEKVLARMKGRLELVGYNEIVSPLITGYFERLKKWASIRIYLTSTTAAYQSGIPTV